MSWVDEKYACINEEVWEALDNQADCGLGAVAISKTWRTLPHPGPASYQATIRVFNEAVRVGILAHVARGVYVIVQNAPDQTPGCHIGCKAHHVCQSEVNVK